MKFRFGEKSIFDFQILFLKMFRDFQILRFVFNISKNFQILRFLSKKKQYFWDFQIFSKNVQYFQISDFFGKFRDFSDFLIFPKFQIFQWNKLKHIGNMFTKIEEILLRILRISYDQYLRIYECLKRMKITMCENTMQGQHDAHHRAQVHCRQVTLYEYNIYIYYYISYFLIFDFVSMGWRLFYLLYVNELDLCVCGVWRFTWFPYFF